MQTVIISKGSCHFQPSECVTMGRSAFLTRSWLGVLLLMATAPRLEAAEKKASDPKDAVRVQEAIAHGLQWLAKNQQEDGSWTLATEPNSSSLTRTPGGTMLAVLPFLLAGHTHREGAFKAVISKRLTQIAKTIKSVDVGGVYGHALGTMVLCKDAPRKLISAWPKMR